MAVQKIKTVFQFRRATAEEWLLNKDVKPAAGEPCFVIDKNILKIGDGVHTFEQLEPINGVKLEIAADGKSIVLDDNVLKLMGFDDAPEGAQPQKDKDGKLKWAVPSTEVIDTLKSDVADLKTSVDSIATDVGGLQTEVSDLKVIIGSDDSGSGTLLSRIEGLEKEVDTIVNGLTPDDGKIDSLLELINYVETHGKKTAKIVSDITTLQELVGSDPVVDQIATATANCVKKISVNGILLDMIDGMVDITIPEIKESDEIAVNEDGTLSIKAISFDKITQSPDVTIIMDGGSAV